MATPRAKVEDLPRSCCSPQAGIQLLRILHCDDEKNTARVVWDFVWDFAEFVATAASVCKTVEASQGLIRWMLFFHSMRRDDLVVGVMKRSLAL